MEKEEKWEKIRKVKYNKYNNNSNNSEWIKEEAYSRKGWGERKCRRIIRFRLKNEMKEERYWEGEEEKKCKLCGSEMESCMGRV